MILIKRTAVLATVALASIGMTACSPGSTNTDEGKIAVTTGFYPLTFATEQIGGNHVAVTSLTKPGAEPHHVELTPKQVTGLAKADVVIFSKGMQGAVDAAASKAKPTAVLDVSKYAKLNLKSTDTVRLQPGEANHAAEEHDHDHEAEEHDHDHGVYDPHFWLDPQRYKAVAKAIYEKLVKKDEKHASDYRKNYEKFAKELDAIDTEYREGLKNCKTDTIVTSHAAFAYMAKSYGFKQVGISGISHDVEPTPQRMANITKFVKEKGITTIFNETLVSPKAGEAIAKITGAKVQVLDPIGGINKHSAGKNYFEIMRSNLKSLESGLNCS